MNLFTSGLGRTGAALALASIVLVALWLTWTPLLGDAAFWVGIVAAGLVLVGVLRAERRVAGTRRT